MIQLSLFCSHADMNWLRAERCQFTITALDDDDDDAY